MTTPDLASLPAADWRDSPDEARRGFSLTPAAVGIHLGTSREGRAVALPAPGPAGTRVVALGEPLFGRLIALRLLAVGALVTAATRSPEQWLGLRQAVGDQLRFTDDPATWPSQTPAPPTVGAGPQALVSDQRRPPAAASAAGAWRTVLHVTRTVPRRAAFWSRPDAVFALSASRAEQIERLIGPEAAERTAGLASGEIILFRPASTEVLRLDIPPAETALLTPGRPAPRQPTAQASPGHGTGPAPAV